MRVFGKTGMVGPSGRKKSVRHVLHFTANTTRHEQLMQHGRRYHAKTDNIGQRVELFTQGRAYSQCPRGHAIGIVKDETSQYKPGCINRFAVEGEHQRTAATKQITECEEVGNVFHDNDQAFQPA